MHAKRARTCALQRRVPVVNRIIQGALYFSVRILPALSYPKLNSEAVNIFARDALPKLRTYHVMLWSCVVFVRSCCYLSSPGNRERSVGSRRRSLHGGSESYRGAENGQGRRGCWTGDVRVGRRHSLRCGGRGRTRLYLGGEQLRPGQRGVRSVCLCLKNETVEIATSARTPPLVHEFRRGYSSPENRRLRTPITSTQIAPSLCLCCGGKVGRCVPRRGRR